MKKAEIEISEGGVDGNANALGKMLMRHESDSWEWIEGMVRGWERERVEEEEESEDGEYEERRGNVVGRGTGGDTVMRDVGVAGVGGGMGVQSMRVPVGS